ncbi:hypothetical protein HPP92_026434 [Vanilla planifolia]|uniref:CAP-Gly domain-containing protein n=1 Tax=Vanilla planifolia TaxID=51239 RepID=A0A835QJP0_VANPL|nr:hypothetical protein HPP92_026434 [Vanilla planifolia]KAG0473854.1 hypothetical protein HPP92_015711 [Vanilla planifolia]
MGEPPESSDDSLQQVPEGNGDNELGIRIGQRVHAVGNTHRIGTVCFVGQLEGHQGEWVGVDWDDGAGKHDGSVSGVRYFTARSNNSASFVRSKNLSTGMSFVEALYLRYRGESTKEEEDEMYVLSSRRRRVAVQFVGKSKIEEKLQHLGDLQVVSIPYLGVGSVNPSHEISNVVPNIKELNLTGNLFSRWQDINSICEALPSLEILNLTRNLMEADIPELPSLKNIQILVLNSCGITWELVQRLECYLQAIEELHLMGNNLRMIMPTPSQPGGPYVQGFNSLRLLNLEDNCIASWNEIFKLSKLRRLQQLHLNKNKLKHVFYTNTDWLSGLQNSCPKPFENLECLLLGSNDIDDLTSIDSLNLFPKLMDIRLSENPIVDPAKGGISRFVLVACLPKVKILNGSEISIRERKESEIRYVRYVLTKMQSANPLLVNHEYSRFEELKRLHAIDEKPSAGIAGPQKMAAGLISVTLICVGASMGERQPLEKKLPPTTTVGRLKVLCESFFNMKGVKWRLFLQEKGSPLPTLLDDDMAHLINIGIGPEGTILVDE